MSQDARCGDTTENKRVVELERNDGTDACFNKYKQRRRAFNELKSHLNHVQLVLHHYLHLPPSHVLVRVIIGPRNVFLVSINPRVFHNLLSVFPGQNIYLFFFLLHFSLCQPPLLLLVDSYNIEFILTFLIFYVLVDLFKATCKCTPAFRRRAVPDEDVTVIRGRDDRWLARMPL